jgi:hypothetical protein
MFITILNKLTSMQLGSTDKLICSALQQKSKPPPQKPKPPPHLWQISGHLLCEQCRILPFLYIVQLIKEARRPLIKQRHYISGHLHKTSSQT